MDIYGWPWGMMAFPGGTTQDDGVYKCYTSVMSEGKTTVTLNLTRSILTNKDFAQRLGYLHDYVLAPTFMTPSSEHDGLTLGFNPEGGTIYGKDYYFCETKGISTEFSVDITKIVPVREGYTFKGWCTDPKEPVESLIDDPGPAGAYYWARKGHTELYAVWSANAAAKKSLKGAKLAVKNQTWTGKALKPAVTVTLDGKALDGGCYSVEYSNNVDIGKATVTVTGKGGYTDSASAAFAINPKAVKLSSVKAGKGSLTAKWKKATGGAGYQIQYSLKNNFKSAKTVTVKVNKMVNTVLKKLKSGKKYYVRIRAWKKVGGKAYTSAWSKALSCKVK